MYRQPFSHLTDPSDVQNAAESIYTALNENGALLTDFFPADGGGLAAWILWKQNLMKITEQV